MRENDHTETHIADAWITSVRVRFPPCSPILEMWNMRIERERFVQKLTHFGNVPVVLGENLDKMYLTLKWGDEGLFKPEVYIPRGEIKLFLRLQYEIDKLFVNIRNRGLFL